MATTVTGLTAHAAEVYFRAATEVNAAISEVADRECAAGFAPHTGRSPAAHMG